jgi:serine/threonine protein kinase
VTLSVYSDDYTTLNVSGLSGVSRVMIYLHSKGIIHRDIKPENILLHLEKRVRESEMHAWIGIFPNKKLDTVLLLVCSRTQPDGSLREQIKLADFGWSVVQRADSVRTTLCGTPDYLPPEVLKAMHAFSSPVVASVLTATGVALFSFALQGEVYGQAVDIWTIGVLSYEFLVGNPPFAVEGDIQLTYDRIESGEFDIPDFVSPAAQDLIRKVRSMP